MTRRISRFVAPLCLLVFFGPALAQDAAPAGEMVVIDLRPASEREGMGLAELNGKCNKDVFRIADVASDPLKVDVLKTDLAEQLGLAGDGKTLTVLNWSIYYNRQVSGGGPSLGGVGIQGYSLPGKAKEKRPGSKCSQRESAGGWYLAGEVTTQYFPLISEFSGTFGGKPVNARVVYSPRVKLAGKFEGATGDTEALLDAVHQTAEVLALAIVQ
ncbi:MAG: hypothetical protein WDO72_15810 [Pseudomonadota bacterium]